MLDDRRIDAFLDTLRAERGAADNTIDAYRRDLEDASSFLRANRTSLVDAGERDLSAFVRDLHERGMSAATVSRRLSALRRFFRFQLGDNERQDNPTSRLDGPAFRRDPPDVLSREEVARLIEAAEGPEPSDLRTMCLVNCSMAPDCAPANAATCRCRPCQRRARPS
jgi:integrase/recombinase XerD